MIVITGMGRTGTSFLASWLRELGHIEYAHGYTKEVNAGIEPLDVTLVNNKLVSGNTSDFKEDIKNFKYPIIKDPRFLYKNVLPYWLQVRKDLKFLVLHREPSAIKESRDAFSKVLGKEEPSYNLSENEINECLGRFVGLCLKNHLPFEFLYFPDFLDQYDLVYKKITLLGLDVSYGRGLSAWYRLVDKNKIHHGIR